jgi:hypothetical protein
MIVEGYSKEYVGLLKEEYVWTIWDILSPRWTKDFHRLTG